MINRFLAEQTDRLAAFRSFPISIPFQDTDKIVHAADSFHRELSLSAGT